jgi:hypothetical protein
MEQYMQGLELTEEMVDEPRMFLNGLVLGCTNLQSMRKHLERCGQDISCWPKWALEEDGHITKSGIAILIWTMMYSKRKQNEPV